MSAASHTEKVVQSPVSAEIIDRMADGDLASLFASPPRSGVVSAWYGHVPFAFWLMEALRPRIFVELGTHNGVSYSAFCEAALRATIETQCFAVDTWKGDKHAGYYDEDVFTDLQSFHDSHYSAFSRMLRMTFDKASEYFSEGSIDLLHVDGCHSYEAVLHDFETWLPKLSLGAVVVFHDTNVRENDFGVWRFWADVKIRYPSFEFVHEHGLGILAVGPNVPEPVLSFCRLNDSSKIATIRARFGQSGRRCVVESALAVTQNELRSANEARLALEAAAQVAADTAGQLVQQSREIEKQLNDALTALREVSAVRDAQAKDLLRNQQEVDRLFANASLWRIWAAQGSASSDLILSRHAAVQLDMVNRLTAVQNELVQTQTRLHQLTQSTMWRALSPIRSLGAHAPSFVRTALRRGLRAAWWCATPWRMSARIRLRQRSLADNQVRPLAAATAPQTAAHEASRPAPLPSPAVASDRFALQLIPPLQGDYQPTVSWYDPIRPMVSVVVLNWNRGDMTLLCLRHLWQNTSQYTYEVVVVDNGSTNEEVDWLRDQAPLARIIPLGTNKFFGEANNIGVESAKGRYVCLLNNDAFVSAGWLAPLMEILIANPKAGAVGPCFRYPDGSLQEAGALVAADGSVIQVGKGTSVDGPLINAIRTVDFVSAACVLLRREDFLHVLGFDLAWDPAYYEDVDLCLKLRLIGLQTIYCPASKVIHIENATSANQGSALGLHNIVEINRTKFVSRWGRYIETFGREKPELVPDRHISHDYSSGLVVTGNKKRVAIYTPYNLTPGGGERYILTIAEAFKGFAAVALITPHPLSRVRLLTMGREFNLDLQHLELLRLGDLYNRTPFDLAFILGNEILPPTGGLGLRNIFICQFPFPYEDESLVQLNRPFWNELDLVLTYSEYVRSHVERRAKALGLLHKEIKVFPPPVPLMVGNNKKRPGQILHVGRFFTGGHCKRQDAMIRAFRTLIDIGVNVELHFAGSTMPEPQNRAYYVDLIAQARGMPVFFHANCSDKELRQLYDESTVYWHATGVGGDVDAAPHTVEHFGISVIEAMSARCIPIVFAEGGPASTVEDGVSGFHFHTIDQLVAITQKVVEDLPAAKLDAIADAAQKEAANYSESIFKAKVRDFSFDLMRD